jgi:DNA-binding MarR family transcriptional regulator
MIPAPAAPPQSGELSGCERPWYDPAMPPNRSTIREEIRQRRPFRSPHQEAVVALLRTATIVRDHFEKALAPHGLTLQQLNVLRILRGAGPDGLPTLEIAHRMVERTPGITRLIDRLERKSLVQRVRVETDRRVVKCRATPAALELLGQLDDVVNAADVAAVEALSETELKQFVDLLDRVRAWHR